MLLQVRYWGPEGEGREEGLTDGDVLASNHPQLAGGSHLPDITVITPVFNDGEIVFFVASRGHHADVGGITPGARSSRPYYCVSGGVISGGTYYLHTLRCAWASWTFIHNLPWAACIAAS